MRLVHGRLPVMVLSSFGLLLTCLMVGVSAQEPAAGPEKESKRAVTTKDNLSLGITYWPSPLGDQGGVVVLLHGYGGSQLEWGTQFPKQIQEKGFAVITVDLRGHGLSKGNPNAAAELPDTKKSSKSKTSKGATVDTLNLKPIDFKNMVALDLEAVKSFIFSEHQAHRLNMNKMALIGAGMGANIAVEWAALDWAKKPHSDGPVGNQTPRGQDVRALVLLSPDPSVAGLPLTDAIKMLKTPAFGVSLLMGVGTKDKLDKNAANKLYDQFSTPDINKERMFFEQYETANRGAAVLAIPKAPTQVIGFLERFVQQANSEWRDRESRLGRKKKD